MRYFVTGCAGFIGSHLVDRLFALGHEVIGNDNLVTGHLDFLTQVSSHPYFKFNQYDLLGFQRLLESMPASCDAVFHFAANADVRGGIDHTDKDLKQNTIATFASRQLTPVIEALKK